jgi:sporulation protein YabP
MLFKEVHNMQDKTVKQSHNLILENRKSLSISGITDVDSFDEREVILYTQIGEMTVQGRELHIDSMSVETGDMLITGEIWAIVYGDRDKHGPLTALGRLFK